MSALGASAFSRKHQPASSSMVSFHPPVMPPVRTPTGPPICSIRAQRGKTERYLDVAGLEGEARDRVSRMAPAVYEVEIGWYVARKL